MTKWLMLQDEIDRIDGLASRLPIGANLSEVDPHAATPMKMSKGAVATITIRGPLLNARSGVLDWFGESYTTYADIRSQIAEAKDRGAKRIDFDVDSPGGTVDGLYQTMGAIKDAGVKTRAIAGPTMASAAYMLASQAVEIIATDESSRIGSIGVAADYVKIFQEVSVANSDSPKKRPNVDTEEGQAVVREQLDEIFQVFAEKIAIGRGVSVETVKKDYGQGAVMTARTALQRRMIDAIQSNQMNQPKPAKTAAETGVKMDAKTLREEHREVYDAVFEAGRKAEREQVCAHLVLADGSGDFESAHKAIRDGEPVNQLIMAQHQSAAMKKAMVQARKDDNPPYLNTAEPVAQDERLATKKGLEAAVPGLIWEVM